MRTARMVGPSMNSQAAGSIPARNTADAPSIADARSEKPTSTEVEASGRGTSRTVTSVISPSLPLLADKESFQVQADHVLMGSSAHSQYTPSRHHGFQAKDPIAGNTVFDGLETSSTGRDIPADSRCLHAGGIRRIEKVVWPHTPPEGPP